MARMIPRAVLVAIGCCVAAGALAREHAPAAKLSAEQIVEKNVAARGGLDAWRKIQTMIWVGHIESAHAPVPSVQFVLEQERPNKSRFEINAMGDKTLRVFDGRQGWKLRPSRGRPEVSPYSMEEVRFEEGGPGIDGVLIDYAAKGRSVEVAGVDDIDQRQAYHLIVRTASDETQHVWVDTKTFLEIRYDRPVPAAGASLTPDAGASRMVSVVYRDYKTFEGLKIPSIIETGVKAGNTPDRMVIEQVVLNPQLDARTFSEPGTHSNRLRAAHGQTAFPVPPHRASAASSLPPWLSSATQAGPQAPSPGAVAPAPAEGNPPPPDSPPQPGSSSAFGQKRE
jgi:hypothetical protein